MGVGFSWLLLVAVAPRPARRAPLAPRARSLPHPSRPSPLKSQPAQGSYALFWLIYYCTLAVGIVLAYAVAALSPNMDVANAALPTLVVTFLFFAGFLLRWTDIPPWWQWYGYIDVLRYAWGSLMANQFAGDRDVVFIGAADGAPPLTILQYYSLDGISPWAWLGLEFCFVVFFTIVAWLALKFVRHEKR